MCQRRSGSDGPAAPRRRQQQPGDGDAAAGVVPSTPGQRTGRDAARDQPNLAGRFRSRNCRDRRRAAARSPSCRRAIATRIGIGGGEWSSPRRRDRRWHWCRSQAQPVGAPPRVARRRSRWHGGREEAHRAAEDRAAPRRRPLGRMRGSGRHRRGSVGEGHGSGAGGQRVAGGDGEVAARVAAPAPAPSRVAQQSVRANRSQRSTAGTAVRPASAARLAGRYGGPVQGRAWPETGGRRTTASHRAQWQRQGKRRGRDPARAHGGGGGFHPPGGVDTGGGVRQVGTLLPVPAGIRPARENPARQTAPAPPPDAQCGRRHRRRPRASRCCPAAGHGRTGRCHAERRALAERGVVVSQNNARLARMARASRRQRAATMAEQRVHDEDTAPGRNFWHRQAARLDGRHRRQPEANVRPAPVASQPGCACSRSSVGRAVAGIEHRDQGDPRRRTASARLSARNRGPLGAAVGRPPVIRRARRGRPWQGAAASDETPGTGASAGGVQPAGRTAAAPRWLGAAQRSAPPGRLG